MNILGLPLWVKAIVVAAVIASAYGGYRAWRHSVWVEGRDATLHAVEQQNQIAAEAAKRVQMTTDKCFDEGGSWNVSTGSCDK